jgi:hypothetical protein
VIVDIACMDSSLVQFGIVMMGALASCAMALAVAYGVYRRTRAAGQISRDASDARRDDQPLARLRPTSVESEQPARKAA